MTKLANALGAPSRAVDDIYVVTNFTKPNVLPAVPTPFGPANIDPDCSPLWEVNMVTWKAGITLRQLNSEVEILAAQAAGEITIAKPGIVVNCAVIYQPGVGILAAATVDLGVTTSGGGGGCVMQPNAPFDPALLLMIAAPGAYLLRRKVKAKA